METSDIEAFMQTKAEMKKQNKQIVSALLEDQA